jgi:microcystin-dependent protein
VTTIAVGQKVTSAKINQWCPPGMVADYAGATPPAGWLLCDGASYLAADYPELFAAIGVLYGTSDAGVHFNVPDCRGRGSVGKGSNADVDVLGDNDGVAETNRSPRHNSTVVQPTITKPTITVSKPAVTITDPGHTHTSRWESSGTGGLGLPASPGADTAVATSSSTTGITAALAATPTASLDSTPIASGGTVGPGGALPVDTPAYIVLNKIIRAKDV